MTGLSTVRAYREQPRFIHTAERGLDKENQAYYMTIAIQRWLSVRLDFLGNILILGIALFAAGFRKTVDPSKIGVVLSYTLSSTFASASRHSMVADVALEQSPKHFVSLAPPCLGVCAHRVSSRSCVYLCPERAEF